MPFSHIRDARLRELLERSRAARAMSTIVRAESRVLTEDSSVLRTRVDLVIARSRHVVDVATP